MDYNFPSFIKQLGTPLNLSFDEESEEYDACDFILNNQKIKYRRAKTTPTKDGKFVTLWKRTIEGPIAPYDAQDEFDSVIIIYSELEYFSFPKDVLIKNRIISNSCSSEGKRAFRLYAPHLKNLNKTAAKTQNWQKNFYYNF